ncbi:MAG: NADP-specific glutamate dehydrogenase [Desulfosarcina sp.]|nr:NADP-specific glutamate dehydrogenase [Desulfobacterales bacterium]
MTDVVNWLKKRDPQEKEFHQAVAKILSWVQPVLDRRPDFARQALLERLIEPERSVVFRVPWMDDSGQVHVNRGYRVEMNSVIGPFKGGLRFHPSVSLATFKALAFEQIFKNALTMLPIGGARGGSDFEPKGKSDNEVMRFCQSFMAELAHHIGPDIDVPGSGMGVGLREIGYLFGAYRKQSKAHTAVITGKGLDWGGSQIRLQSTGYGVVYFATEALATRNRSLEGMQCLVSGSGNVAQHTVEKIIELGGKVLTVSDSSGYIFDQDGIDAGKLAFIKRLKNLKRGRIREYVDKYSETLYVETDLSLDHNPLWNHAADCALPCAAENEINSKDATNLVNNGVKLVCEGADLPSTTGAIDIFLDNNILYAPCTATNAGGVAIASLEMSQNRMLLNWSAEEVDNRLKNVMKNIHRQCLETATEYGQAGNYVMGANIAGFTRVVNAMWDQGLI